MKSSFKISENFLWKFGGDLVLGEESPAEQSAFCGDQSESYNEVT